MSDWLFDQKPNTAAITTRQVLEKNLPVTIVIHYEDDHSWAFLCGTTSADEDGRVVPMKKIIERDPTLNAIAGLRPGETATRKSIGGSWKITKT